MYVPISKDGSTLDPKTCCRAGGFWVGPKGNEQRFSTYSGALAALRLLDRPSWRRPNSAGNWGLVAAVRWGLH
jgi:hypothetical protein